MAMIDMVDSQLRLTFVTGNDPDTGNPIFTYKSFNNVRTDAEPSQLLNVAHALASLQTYSLYKIERNDRSEISEAS